VDGSITILVEKYIKGTNYNSRRMVTRIQAERQIS